MKLDVDIQTKTRERVLPHPNEVKRWAASAYEETQYSSVGILIVDKEEIQNLNLNYRDKDKPTNVLSFPMDLDEGFFQEEPYPLGDIIICAEVVKEEAIRDDKDYISHFAHMVVHGMLHLQGYDHEKDEEAAIMEGRETEILASLNIKDPYAENTYANS